MKALLVALVLVSLSSSVFGETKADIKTDYDLVCNAIARSGADKIDDPSQKAQTIANFLTKKIKTKTVRNFMASLAGMRPEDKGPALKKAAAEAGYTGTCPLADSK